MGERKRLPKGSFSARALKSLYGPHALSVLASHFIEEGGVYTIIEGKSQPSREEYNKLAEAYYTYTVAYLIEDAFSVIEGLAEEMREGYDNMESGNLGATQKCQTYGETADTLEGVQAPELPDCLSQIETVRYPTISKSTGRAHRAGEAASDLNLAADAIEEWVTEKREMLDERDDDDNEAIEDELDLDGLDALVESLREAAGEVEGCEFPGMFG